MCEKDSNDEELETSGEEDSMSEDETDFLGAGPKESLEMNSSAEEAFSPK